MNPFHRLHAGASAAPVFLLALLAFGPQAHASPSGPDGARAGDPVPPFVPTPESDAVLYDEPGDGRLWALGASWKASFGADGATYFPRVGADVQRSLPHTLSPESVTVGGEALVFAREVPATLAGDRVEMDRGSFVEAYELAPHSVEQLFVFDSLPNRGELVLRMPVGAELDTLETDDGIEFRSGPGRVTYSRAVAIDARGRRAAAATRVEDGAVVIRVSPEFLATAQLPLIVDPVLNAIFPDSTTTDTFSTDVAYSTFDGVWLFVYETVFSASDHDIVAKMYSATGTLTATATVDASTLLWAAPRIAYLHGAQQFLCVAAVGTTGSRNIRGRTVEPNGTIITQGSQFTISDASAGEKFRPDVGGDPYPFAGASWYCVVWEHAVNESIPVPDHRIVYQRVSSSSALAGLPVTLPTTPGGYDASPSISKSNGENDWLIAWQHNDQILNGDIFAAHVRWNGTLVDGPFTVAGGPGFEAPPCASSPLTGTNKFAVTWHSGIGSGRRIRVAAVDGTTVLHSATVQSLEGSPSAEQIEPSIDSDGTHFLVSYSEFVSGFLYYELKVSDLALAGNTLTVAQNHLTPQPGLGLSQRNSQVAAARTTGALAHRYLVSYHIRQNDQDHDVAGRFIEGVTGGSWKRFCFGDGTGTACPCGNNGAPMQGCSNSVVGQGAVLDQIAGTPTSTDTNVMLRAGSMPPNTSCLFFQGTIAGPGAAFGDGLRCATGSVIRLANSMANASGIAVYPSTGDLPVITAGAIPPAGGMRSYQVWYRNAAAFCTASTFNLTNGFQIFWAP